MRIHGIWVMNTDSVLLIFKGIASIGTRLESEYSQDMSQDSTFGSKEEGNINSKNTYRGTRKLESRVRRVFVIPGKSWENPSASVANAAKAPCEIMPCG